MILQQLEMKFGDLPEHIRKRIQVADNDMLTKWGKRVLTAEKIDDIFDDE